MKLWQPMNDRILVERITEPSGKSRIVIPEKYQQSAHIGRVRAVGPGKRIEGINGGTVRRPVAVKVGDLIAFGRFTDWDVDGTVLIQEGDIMFKIDGPVKIGIDKFTHNEVGVDRLAGSLESMFDES
jgi:co-chaperonin GroES (HSP10)